MKLKFKRAPLPGSQRANLSAPESRRLTNITHIRQAALIPMHAPGISGFDNNVSTWMAKLNALCERAHTQQMELLSTEVFKKFATQTPISGDGGGGGVGRSLPPC